MAPTPPTIEQLALQYVAARTRQQRFRGTTPRTIRNKLLQFADAIGPNLPVTKLTRRKIERWAENLNLAPSTTRMHISTVRTFTAWLASEDYLKADPARSLQLPRLPRSLPRGIEHDAVTRLHAHAPDSRAHLIISLMVQEGLRCKEVAGIQIGDINRSERSLFVREGKGGHQRVLPISDETWMYLNRYLSDCPTSYGPLIRSRVQGRTYDRVLPATISQYVSDWMKEAGLKSFPKDGVSAHALRHTAATDMLRSGAHLRDVQAALGHSSLAITQRYLPWVVGDLRTAMGGRVYEPGAGTSDVTGSSGSSIPPAA